MDVKDLLIGAGGIGVLWSVGEIEERDVHGALYGSPAVLRKPIGAPDDDGDIVARGMSGGDARLIAAAPDLARQCLRLTRERDEARAERDYAQATLELYEEDIDENLPEYVLGDGTGDFANCRERIEFAGDDIDRITRRIDDARLVCWLFAWLLGDA